MSKTFGSGVGRDDKVGGYTTLLKNGRRLRRRPPVQPFIGRSFGWLTGGLRCCRSNLLSCSMQSNLLHYRQFRVPRWEQ